MESEQWDRNLVGLGGIGGVGEKLGRCRWNRGSERNLVGVGAVGEKLGRCRSSGRETW